MNEGGIVAIVAAILTVGGSVAAVLWKILSRKDRGILEQFTPSPSYVPIVLFLDESLLEEVPHLGDALWQAVRFMNESVGGTLFLNPGEFKVPSGEVIPILAWEEPEYKTCHENAAAFTRIDPTGKPESIFVLLKNIVDMSEEQLVFAMAHELGHVVGLDHDDFTNSFMFHKVLPNSPEMTDKDRLLLRELYGIQDATDET